MASHRPAPRKRSSKKKPLDREFAEKFLSNEVPPAGINLTLSPWLQAVPFIYRRAFDEDRLRLAARIGVRTQEVDVSDRRDSLVVLVNPEIVEATGVSDIEEGCLSVPGIYELVERAEVHAVGQPRQLVVTGAEGPDPLPLPVLERSALGVGRRA